MEEKDRDAQNREDLLARERIRDQWMLESVSKVRLFFAGLVFAMLAFSVQFAVVTENRAAKGCQLAAWILLLLTGMLAVRDAGGFVTKNTEDVFDGLSPAIRRRMWWCFVLAVVLLMSTRVLPEADWGWAIAITKYLTLTGLVLDIAGVLVIGLRAQHWMQQFWKDAPAIFDTRLHKWIYYGAWWAIAIGFALQALGVLLV